MKRGLRHREHRGHREISIFSLPPCSPCPPWWSFSPRRGRPMSYPSMLIESLESRRLLTAVYPSNLEQYEVELINRARANPAAEAARYGIDLNEGLAPGTIST